MSDLVEFLTAQVTEDIDECPELRDLASVYADEPDYQEGRRP